MTTLKEEEPFAFVADTDKLSTICSFCFNCDKPVNKCTSCHALYYCSRSCQKSDWVNHKKECLLLKKALESTGTVPETTIRLVARILLKSEKALAQKAFNGRSWRDLDCRIPEINVEMSKTFVMMVPPILDFLKPLLKNNCDVDLAFTLGKVQYHKIDIFHSRDCVMLLGIGIYLGFSVNKHSCVPDSQLIFNGTKASLRCFDQTRTKNSSDLTISYNGIPVWNLDRKDFFIKKYFEDCTCTFCVDENHIFKRMGSSCRVSCCKDAAGILDEVCSEGPYKCNKCGEASTITVDTVKRAETKIQQFFAQMKEPNYTFDMMKVKKLVQESEKVLSVYNFHFIYFCERNEIRERFNSSKKNKELQIFGRDLTDKRLKGYSYYLNEMDVRMAVSLLDRVVTKLGLDSDDSYDIYTAIDVAERALGERHPAFVFFQKIYDDFKRENEKKRDELFREAAQFKW